MVELYRLSKYDIVVELYRLAKYDTSEVFHDCGAKNNSFKADFINTRICVVLVCKKQWTFLKIGTITIDAICKGQGRVISHIPVATL